MGERADAIRAMAARPVVHDYSEPGFVSDGRIILPCPSLASIVQGMVRNTFVGAIVSTHCMYRMPEALTWIFVANGARGVAVRVVGPHSRVDVETLPPWTTSMCGAMLHPGALGPLFGRSAAELSDGGVDLEDLLGARGLDVRLRLEDARSLDEQLVRLEQAILGLARAAATPAAPVSVQVARAVTRAAPRRSSELERISGWSQRQLRRHFDHDLGLSPKRYLRLLRFGRVIDHLRAPRPRPWGEVAADLGYADQAHLIHEFREFTGLSPGAFLDDPASAPALRHGAVPRARPAAARPAP